MDNKTLGPTPKTVASVILAAGKSSRMNFPKALVEVHGRSFLSTIIDAHLTASLPVHIVLGADQDQIQRSVDMSNIPVFVNLKPDQGPLSSLQIALDELGDYGAILVHPVDHPLVTAQTLVDLTLHFQKNPDGILIPEFHGKKGHPVLFPSRFYGELKAAPLQEGARWVVHHNTMSVVPVPVEDPGILQNINTPNQLIKVLKSL